MGDVIDLYPIKGFDPIAYELVQLGIFESEENIPPGLTRFIFYKLNSAFHIGLKKGRNDD